MLREKKSTITEKRRNPRIDTSSVVGYILYDEQKNKIGHGKGYTINLSQGGALLQTEHKINASFIVLMAMDLDGNKIKFGGKIIKARICKGTGYHLTGIEFLGPMEKNVKPLLFLSKIIKKESTSLYKIVSPIKSNLKKIYNLKSRCRSFFSLSLEYKILFFSL
jgi:hypothetical protein